MDQNGIYDIVFAAIGGIVKFQEDMESKLYTNTAIGDMYLVPKDKMDKSINDLKEKLAPLFESKKRKNGKSNQDISIDKLVKEFKIK